MIIVTGANGHLGRAVVERLLELVPAEQIGVSVRDPEKASALAALGVRVRRGEFDDPASLADAFEGVSWVLIVSVNSFGEAAARQHRMAINAAKAAGAQRIVYTSHMAASEDGPIAYTAHSDLAAAAAIALTGEELDGVTPALTGFETFDLASVAALASELTGRPIRRVVVPDSEYRAIQAAKGVPDPMADILLDFFAASRQGQFAPADPTLARLLGRPATPLRDVLKAALSPTG